MIAYIEGPSSSMTGANFETFAYQPSLLTSSFPHHRQDLDLSGDSVTYLDNSSFPFSAHLPSQTKVLEEEAASATITTMPARPRFAPMFQAAAEVSPFNVTYRWWEDEGSAVLYAYDAREICQVIRFCLFVDRNWPKSLLIRRAGSLIEDFLGRLLRDQFGVHTDPNAPHEEKVEDIFRRLEPPAPSSPNWSWFPAQARHEKDPRTIANKIDAESHIHFKDVSFEEWVRLALGYSSSSVDRFLLQHDVFLVHMLRYLESHEEEVEKYLEVEKHMRSRSPFAHRVLVRALAECRPALAAELAFTVKPGFDFIAGPLQHLFQHNQSLSEILKILSILANRFRQNYVHVARMNWTQPFETRLPFLEDVFLSTDTHDLARILTSTDQASFVGLTRQDIVNGSPRAKKLQENWQSLSMEVYECCSAVPEIIPYFQETMETLYELKNYHSATAMMEGLQAYCIGQALVPKQADGQRMLELPTVQPQHVAALLDSSDTYAVYLHRMQEAPGIPFLYPHILQYKLIGEGAFTYLFR